MAEPKDKIKSDGSTADYYLIPSHATQLGHLISYKNMTFNIGTVFKACYRLGEKYSIDKRYDLKKIIRHAQMELEELDRLENEYTEAHTTRDN